MNTIPPKKGCGCYPADIVCSKHSAPTPENWEKDLKLKFTIHFAFGNEAALSEISGKVIAEICEWWIEKTRQTIASEREKAIAEALAAPDVPTEVQVFINKKVSACRHAILDKLAKGIEGMKFTDEADRDWLQEWIQENL